MKKQTVLYFNGIVAASLLLATCATQAQSLRTNVPLAYNDVFISYYSPANVIAMANFAKTNQLGGFILWEIRGDTPYTDKSTSLLANLADNIKNYKVNGSVAPVSMGYWTNWGVYSDNSSSAAIPQPAYPIPGSIAPYSQPGNPVYVSNADFTHKLDGMNVVTYSFLEAQTKRFTYYDSASGQSYTIENKTPEKIGTLYFNDPWADLQVTGGFPKQDALCQQNRAVCEFALKNRYTPIGFDAGAKMGNFNAFSKLAHATTSNPLGTLKKIISVGGYGHDDSFEDAFNLTGVANFTTSAAQIVNAYDLDGIDLDYENPKMTWEQSEQYLTLIQAMRNALPGKFISVTIMTDAAYISGDAARNYGFKPGVLAKIAAAVDYINLMTYDFHGAFDYSADGKGTTGFLTNLYMPENKPENYRFSVDDSVKAALAQNVPRRQLNLGIPAYGRALAGIDAGKNNDGLFQSIKSSSSIPKGDFDAAHCNTAITPLDFNSCNGSFSYHYIMKNMVGHGFSAKSDVAQGVSNSVSAYSKQWSPPQTSYKLIIKNTGSQWDDAGFNVTVGGFTAPDYFNLGVEKSYSPVDIMDKTGLDVSVIYWKGESTCTGKLDFTSNTEVDILIHPADGIYSVNCTFKQL